MDYKAITILLDRYFDGATSLAEEAQLREFFQKHTLLPAELAQYAPLFRYTAQEQQAVAAVKTRRPKHFQWTVAASVVLLIGLSINYYYATYLPQMQAQKALDEFKMGMNYLSQNLNKGKQSLHYINYFDVSKNKIFK
jgi:hypothetical protein